MAATKLGRLAIAAVSVFAASVAMDIGSASAQLEAPRVGVLQVEVPSVPPVPVAPVAPPALPSPPAVPPVDVPDVQVPSVQVPDVPVPVPRAPSAPGATGPDGVIAPDFGGSAEALSPPSSGSSTSPGSSPRGSGDGRPARALREARAAAAARRRRPASPPISSRSERGLRREVQRLSGCAATLPALERRVLDLRAGLDGAAPSPRRTVARRLDMPLAHVRRAERDGLATLRRTDRASGCAAGSASMLSISWMSLMASVGVAPELTTMASLEGSAIADAAAAGRDRVAVLGDRESSDEGTTVDGVPHTEPDAATPPTAASIGDGSGMPLLSWVVLLVVVLAATAASPALLRRRRGASAAGPAVTNAATPEPETTRPPEARVEASAPLLERPAPTAPPRETPAAMPHHEASNPVGPHHASGRTVGVVVSSAMSLAVGVAMWARRRSGGRRRR